MTSQWLKKKITNKQFIVIGIVDDEDPSERKASVDRMVGYLERHNLLTKTRTVGKTKYHKLYVEILAKGKNIFQIKKYRSGKVLGK